MGWQYVHPSIFTRKDCGWWRANYKEGDRFGPRPVGIGHLTPALCCRSTCNILNNRHTSLSKRISVKDTATPKQKSKESEKICTKGVTLWRRMFSTFQCSFRLLFVHCLTVVTVLYATYWQQTPCFNTNSQVKMLVISLTWLPPV